MLLKSQKRKRKMSLLQKVEALFSSGQGISAVGRHYGANELTICFIKKNEYKIRVSIKSNAPLSATISC
jgi:hypothetical protein